MADREFLRNKDGIRLTFKGVNIRAPWDQMPEGKYPYAQNVRPYLTEQTTERDLQGPSITVAHTGKALCLRRMNDPLWIDGPVLVFRISPDQAWVCDLNNHESVEDLGIIYSGFPSSLNSWRPSSTPSPWMYISDANVMRKCSAGGKFYQQGIAEPQIAPTATPGAGGAITGSYVYFGVYRSIEGAYSNPSPATGTVSPASQVVDLTMPGSADPQVFFVDYYRQSVSGGGLVNPTYVGTSTLAIGANYPFEDTLTDLDVANNPLMEFDNFEPFPSIDLPRNGILNWTLSTNTAVYAGGDVFNTRWAPGNLILLSSTSAPYGQVGQLYNRPQSASTMTLTGITLPDGNYTWHIYAPTLLAQPLPAEWGPTDNAAFFFACGDPLRPGTLYWTKGNNPDSAPDTNQMEVTSPSEPLMNGCIVGGLGMVFSTERAWLIYQNFFNALATATGVVGSQWILIESIATRGLFARFGVCTDGGGNVYFRGKDGVYVSPGGFGCNSITDDDLYSLFPHEGSSPKDYTITVGANVYTIYAPDSNQAGYETLKFSNGFLYWDYIDTHGSPRTLVYSVEAKGWVPDVYHVPATCHADAEGNAIGVYMGCSDGTLRQLQSAGTEDSRVVLVTPCFNAGDTRADKQFGDIFLNAIIPINAYLNYIIAGNLFTKVVNPSSTPTPGTGPARASYILDLLQSQSGSNTNFTDIALQFAWNLGTGVVLFVWQPSLLAVPETIQLRPSDWDNCGDEGAKFLQGFVAEADTSNTPVTIEIDDDFGAAHAVNEAFQFDGRSAKAFSFAAPFISHLVRLRQVVTAPAPVLPWRLWGIKWVFVPFPELVKRWQTEGMSHGNTGWQHIREMNLAHISTADLSLVLTFDYWPTITVLVPNSGGAQKKTRIVIPENKFKIVSYALSSTAPFRLFVNDVEVKVGPWKRTDAYRVLKPFGGQTQEAARI
jgi:hypothetical protein